MRPSVFRGTPSVWCPCTISGSLRLSGSPRRSPSRPAGVAVAPAGGGRAGPGRVSLVPAPRVQRRGPSGTRTRTRTRSGGTRSGGTRPGPAMWFIYVLSWLSLLIQVAFVTLAIGEPAAGGGRDPRGVGPAAGPAPACRDMSCVGQGRRRPGLRAWAGCPGAPGCPSGRPGGL